MLRHLRITNYIAPNQNGEEKRYYVIERRVLPFIWRVELRCTNYKKVTQWIKERLDFDLDGQYLD